MNYQNQTSVGEEEEEEQHFSYAMQLVTSASLPMVLLSAIRLDVFEIIAEAGEDAQLSPYQIAARIRMSSSSSSSSSSKNPEAPSMLDRMLRLLASYSILTCSVVAAGAGEGEGPLPRVYGLAPVAKYFVRRNSDGASLGGLLGLLQDKVFIDCWYELEGAVREGGIPFKRAHGIYSFEYPGKNPKFSEVFNKAMTDQATITINRILERYKGFEHLKMKSLVDVGGGLGITINIITTKYPSIRGVNFDLPYVIQHAPAYPGVEHVGGDMFQNIPKGDAIFMKLILHFWDDEHCLKLLKNCYEAIPDDGKLIVVDALVPLKPDTSARVKSTFQNDLIMLTQNSGGKERSEQEFLALATAAGFQGMIIVCFVCNLWIMEFYK